MKTIEWNEIEAEFINWDNKDNFSASQRQILDFFKKRFINKEKELIKFLQWYRKQPHQGYKGINTTINEYLGKILIQ
jgi:hypothetical protein